MGAADKDGHCTVFLNYYEGFRAVGLHRFSFHVFKNYNLNEKSLICHKPECNNPNCWNPDHLYEGDNTSNNLDTVRAGTNYHLNKTHCPSGHEYNQANTGMTQEGHRYCKECSRIKIRNSRAQFK